MKCIKCENEARADCANHIQTQRFVSGFSSVGGVWSWGDNALSVDDAVWCGICTPQYHMSK